MGKLLMIREADDRRIERLKRQLGIASKVDVVRAGMDLLEAAAERQARVVRWRRAAGVVSVSSRGVSDDFRSYSRLKRG